MAYSDEVIAAAKSLYLKRHTPKEIQKKLGLNSPRIVYYWATKFEWYTQLNTEGVEDVIAGVSLCWPNVTLKPGKNMMNSIA